MAAQTKITIATTLKGHGKTDSFTDSAEKVPKKFGNKRPMHYRAIADKALELGWLVSGGKMPEASMYAQILRKLNTSTAVGSNLDSFSMVGYFGLSKWMGGGLVFGVHRHAELKEIPHKERDKPL